MEEWKILVLDDYKNVVMVLNTLKLKKENILTLDKDKESGKITVIYYN
ncbi:hypothetical protein [Clostridium sp. VAP23]|nr:hypothetical protein [Clostridium sp. VAP23]